MRRPLTKRLGCFADPVEHFRGQFDQLSTYRDTEPQAHYCAGCPVKAFCAVASWERVNSSSNLRLIFDTWERETKLLTGIEAYRHPTWSAFVDACEAFSWPDCNEAAIEAERGQKRAGRKAAKPKRSRSVRPMKPKPVPKAVRKKIAGERDRRATKLLSLAQRPDAPLAIKNRSVERCLLIADAWQARTILEEAGQPASGRAVMKLLIDEARVQPDLPTGFVARVNEALRVSDRLFEDFDCSWEPKIRRLGDGFHPNAVWQLLDDDH